MAGRSAALLERAYAVWPSFAGAFLLLSIAACLVIVPLVLASARANARMAAAKDEVAALQARWKGDRVEMNGQMLALYQRSGVGPTGGCLTTIAAGGLLVVSFLLLLQLVHGLAATDPRVTNPSTELGAAVTAAGGHLRSVGLDLSASAATFAGEGIEAAPYLVLPALLGLSSVVRHRVTTFGGGAARPVPMAGVLAAFGLFVPSAVLIYLVTVSILTTGGLALTRPPRTSGRGGRRPPVRIDPWPAFQRTKVEADELALAGDAAGAVERLTTGIKAFLRDATPGEANKRLAEIEAACASVVTARPSEGARLLARLAAKCIEAPSEQGLSRFLAAWASSPHISAFRDDWSTLAPVVARRADPPVSSLLAAVRAVPAVSPSRAFSRQATEHFLDTLDTGISLSGQGAGAAPGETGTLELLETLSPGRRAPSRSDLYCQLGDMAFGRGQRAEAVARYEHAHALGCGPAASRLADLLAAEGHRLLIGGEAAVAAQVFATALERRPDDPEYQLLTSIARLIAGLPGRPTQQALKQLASRGVPRPTVAFWSGVAYLVAEKPERAADALRPVAASAPGSGRTWGMADEAAVLRATVDHDDSFLVECARALLGAAGGPWGDGGPSDPWALAAATARADEALFVRLLESLPSDAAIPDWAATAGGRAALCKSVEAAREGRLGDALGHLDLADRMLTS